MINKEKSGLILNREDIKERIEKERLVSGYIDPGTQVTPNGFDLTVGSIYAFGSCGSLDFSNKERKLPEFKELAPKKIKKSDKFGWWKLKKGCYKVLTNESVKIPNDLMGIAFSRSSLLRMGVFVENAVWDAGFSGRSEFILVVENPHGFNLKENARVAQLVFLKTAGTEEGYNGIYKGL